jgi:hypothetical protein
VGGVERGKSETELVEREEVEREEMDREAVVLEGEITLNSLIKWWESSIKSLEVYGVVSR